MPRTARVVLPGYPHHVIQRGHNRAPVFVRDADYAFYLETLKEWKGRLKCRVYAYCLMTNHVHLVIEPGENASSLALLMKRIAARYTRYINRVEQRSGTVWNGRYKSSPIETDRYFLACCRYVDLNPVRAGIVASPELYPWSSYPSRVGSSNGTWLDEHSLFKEFGNTELERRARYRNWVHASIPDDEWELIRTAAHRGQLTGGTRFLRQVEECIGHRVELRGRGRPRVKKNIRDRSI